jgi:hypothetical protein
MVTKDVVRLSLSEAAKQNATDAVEDCLELLSDIHPDTPGDYLQVLLASFNEQVAASVSKIPRDRWKQFQDTAGRRWWAAIDEPVNADTVSCTWFFEDDADSKWHQFHDEKNWGAWYWNTITEECFYTGKYFPPCSQWKKNEDTAGRRWWAKTDGNVDEDTALPWFYEDDTESNWQLFHDQKNSATWYWNAITKEWFYTGEYLEEISERF